MGHWKWAVQLKGYDRGLMMVNDKSTLIHELEFLRTSCLVFREVRMFFWRSMALHKTTTFFYGPRICLVSLYHIMTAIVPNLVSEE